LLSSLYTSDSRPSQGFTPSKEQAFGYAARSEPAAPRYNTVSKARAEYKDSKSPSDIDSLLDMLSDGDEGERTHATHNHCEPTSSCYSSAITAKSPSSRAAALDGSRRRCGALCLAGSALRGGCAVSSISQCACDKLRCTACDFPVLSFEGAEWDSSADYMFFRNNMPSREKLSVMLLRRPAARAYACQCSWRSAVEVVRLGPASELRWVCGGH
jgi:Retinal Maintenance